VVLEVSIRILLLLEAEPSPEGFRFGIGRRENCMLSLPTDGLSTTLERELELDADLNTSTLAEPVELGP
jgi:hypothetical protein